MSRFLIFNADDFGLTQGINRGIAQAHERGVVTSASLMVGAPAARDAAATARDLPNLSIGLHWMAPSTLERGDTTASLVRQLGEFEQLLGRPPSHLDSHYHLHWQVLPTVREVVIPLGIPVREPRALRVAGIPIRRRTDINFISLFFGQTPTGRPARDRIQPRALEGLLRDHVEIGWNEIMCHPGHVTAGLTSGYREEREIELATLVDPRIRESLLELGIELRSFSDYIAAGLTTRDLPSVGAISVSGTWHIWSDWALRHWHA